MPPLSSLNKFRSGPVLKMSLVTVDLDEEDKPKGPAGFSPEEISGKDTILKIVGSSGEFAGESGDKTHPMEDTSASVFLGLDSKEAAEK